MTAPVSNSATRALGGVIAGLLDAPAQVASALAGTLTRRSSSCSCSSSRVPVSCGSGCCEIPPPCWEPRPAGTCFLELTPGGSGTIRVHVSNCGWTRQIVALTALGKLAGWMTFAPTTFLLGPQERATVLVTVHVPAAAHVGQRFSTPLIIRGCLDHFARIEIAITDCAGARTCCDVCVDDCQDQIHHWYDHFYCPRPCHNLRLPVPTPVPNPVPGRLVNDV